MVAGLALLACACASSNRAVTTSAAPSPIGPYSQAVARGEFVFVSGQIGVDPKTSRLVEGGIAPETERVLANLRAVLAAESLDFGDVVLVQVYLTDLADFSAFNALYARALGACAPARATVQVAALPGGACVEVQCTAMRR
jgi:2-iminobutanoate/2-iminopropanoate deaminase